MKLNISNCRPLLSQGGDPIVQFTLSFLDDNDLPFVSCNGMLYTKWRRVLPTRTFKNGPKIVELRSDIIEALEGRLAGVPEVQRVLGEVSVPEKDYLKVDETLEV